jgi:hypothetical protein
MNKKLFLLSFLSFSVFANWDTTNLLGRCNNGKEEVFYQDQSNQGNISEWIAVDNLSCVSDSQLQANCNNNKVVVNYNNNKYNVNAPCQSITTQQYPQAVIVDGGNFNPFMFGLEYAGASAIANGMQK